jgi:hypothetical protein
MAQLPSLALGIGLQGKPIDRAALNLRRAEGEERAALRAQQKAQKELEPYKRRIFAVGDKAYLPVHKEMMSNKVANTWKYLSENADNLDYQQLGNMIFDIESLSGIAQKEYNQYVKNVNNPNNSLWADELKVLGTATDPSVINDALGGGFGLSGEIAEDGSFAVQMRKAVPADMFAETIIKSEGDRLWQEVGQGEIVGKGKADYLQLRPRMGIVDEVTRDALANPDVTATEGKLLLNELSNSGRAVDLTNEAQRADFIKMRDERIAQKVRNKFDITSAERQPKGSTFNFNMGETEQGKVLAPGRTSVRINEQYSAPLYSFYSLGDKSITIPATDKTFSLGGGRLVRSNTATYNTVGVTYRTSKDKTFDTPQGKITIKEGTLVPEEEIKRMLENGFEVKPDAVAFFKDADGQWGYDVATGALQSYFLGETKEDKQRIEMINAELNKKIEELNSIKKSVGSQKGSTQQSQPKSQSTQPKGESNLSKWDKNKR